MDVKYLPSIRPRSRPEPLQQYLHTAIDDCTRLQVAWVSSELTPQASVRFFQLMLQAYPFPIQAVQTDHCVEFTYVFFPHVQKPHPLQEALEPHGIHHKLIPVGMPNQNGKVERSHRTLDEECLNTRTFPQARSATTYHPSLAPLLQHPAAPFISGLVHSTPEAQHIPRLPGCYPCLKTLQSETYPSFAGLCRWVVLCCWMDSLAKVP